MKKALQVFIASDVHGKFNELWLYVQKQGFQPGNINHLLILNGDIIDFYDPLDEIIAQLKIIRTHMQQYKNIIYIKGNHEARLKLDDNEWQTFINRLPMVYINDNLFVCHGWFNPYWSIAEHKNKMTNDDYAIANYGEIHQGSPHNIIVRQSVERDYFGFKSLEAYEQALIEIYPNHTFVFGHYFSFLWKYEKCLHMHYFIYKAELAKLNQGLPNLITTMSQEFDYSQPYVSLHKKIYCIDVFTKCFKNNLPYYFYVLKMNSDYHGDVYDEDGQLIAVDI